MRILPWWAYAAAAIACFGTGWWLGDAVRAKQMAKLRNTVHAEEVRRLTRVNDDNAKEIDRLNAAIDFAATRNAELRLLLEKHEARVVIRTRWREHEREANAECRAWLDAPVPCRLQPDGGAGGVQGTGDVRPAS